MISVYWKAKFITYNFVQESHLALHVRKECLQAELVDKALDAVEIVGCET